MSNCTKPNCQCIDFAELKAGGPVKEYPCLAAFGNDMRKSRNPLPEQTVAHWQERAVKAEARVKELEAKAEARKTDSQAFEVMRRENVSLREQKEELVKLLTKAKHSIMNLARVVRLEKHQREHFDDVVSRIDAALAKEGTAKP